MAGPEKPQQSPPPSPDTGKKETPPQKAGEQAIDRAKSAIEKLEARSLDEFVKSPNCEGTVYKKGADYDIQGYNPSNGDEIFYKITERGKLERTALTMQDMIGASQRGKLTEKFGWNPLDDLSKKETQKLTTLGLSETTAGTVGSLKDLLKFKGFNGSTVYEKGGSYYILGYNSDTGEDIIFKISDGGVLQNASLQMNNLIGGRSVGKFTKEGKWNALSGLAYQEVDTLKKLGLQSKE